MNNRFIIRTIILLTLFVYTWSWAVPRVDYLYLHPKPNATLVSPEAMLMIRLDSADPSDVVNLNSFIQVFGSKSGNITGRVTIASDDKTILFRPDRDFAWGEKVTVNLQPKLKTTTQPSGYSYTFKTLFSENTVTNLEKNKSIKPANSIVLSPHANGEGPRIMPNGVSVPSDFPHINVFINKETADGYIFLNNWRGDGPYNIMFDNDGSPVWYERQADGDRRRDFKVQKNGIITMLTRRGGQRFLGYDENMNLIDEFRTTGGYGTDEHELQVLENGHYLIIGNRGVEVDMSEIIEGGKPNANVRETTVQEFTADHELILNWPALEHLSDGLPYLELDNPKGNSFRFPHFNAIDVDKDDGHLLVSSRHLSEMTKFNRQSGEIIWRLGGVHSDFTFVNDPLDGFRNQHDIRSLGNGLYSVFDNGNNHNPNRSRGVTYKLDTEAKTATLVWEYRNPQGSEYSHYMGNHQTLPNGNSLINWAVGSRPKATEVTPDGEVVFEMNFVDRYDTYRAFRFPWNGIVDKPRLFVEPANNGLVLIFNKFGDDNVAFYNIYGDTSPNPTTLIDTSKTTLKKIAGLQNDRRYYFRVTAVSGSGLESDYSNTVDIFITFVSPGQNLVENGDFTRGVQSWDFNVQGADASSSVTNQGEIQIKINNAGSDFENVQLKQGGLAVVRGGTYLFEFDAYATENRSIEAHIERVEPPWDNYGKITPTSLRRVKHHYAYEFIMEQSTDLNAQVVFNCGLMSADVFIDNVSLTNIDGELPITKLPSPWKNRDIGQIGKPGEAGIWQDRYLVKGSGNDIWGTGDQFHFAYQEIADLIEISARLVTMEASNGWAKAGIMIRNTLEPGSTHAFMCTTISNGTAFQRRVDKNSGSLNINKEGREAPYWVKLVRRGNVFQGYESSDGENWTRVGVERIIMNESVYVGFAVTAHDNGELCHATFDDLKIVTQTTVRQTPDRTLPHHFILKPAFPNPFNPSTTISFELPARAGVKLTVYNLSGKQVNKSVKRFFEAGEHNIEFDGSALSSGVYFYAVEATLIQNGERFTAIDKMTLIK